MRFTKNTLCRTLLVISTFFVLSTPAIPAESLTAEEVAERNLLVGKVADSLAEGTIRLISSNGRERVRKTITKTKLKPGTLDNRNYVTFISPPDVKGTSVLTVENGSVGRDDDIWIYLPALKKVRRLAASNKKDSFMGTDFSYGDVIGFKVAQWNYRILREESLGGVACYVVEATPKSAQILEDSGYGKRIVWIRKDNFVAVKGEAYDRGGAMEKIYRVSEYKQVDSKGNKWIPMKMEAENVQTEHRTVIVFDKYSANTGLADEIFTVRELESVSW